MTKASWCESFLWHQGFGAKLPVQLLINVSTDADTSFWVFEFFQGKVHKLYENV